MIYLVVGDGQEKSLKINSILKEHNDKEQQKRGSYRIMMLKLSVLCFRSYGQSFSNTHFQPQSTEEEGKSFQFCSEFIEL